jgi:hypothetical protein
LENIQKKKKKGLTAIRERREECLILGKILEFDIEPAKSAEGRFGIAKK